MYFKEWNNNKIEVEKNIELNFWVFFLNAKDEVLNTTRLLWVRVLRIWCKKRSKEEEDVSRSMWF